MYEVARARLAVEFGEVKEGVRKRGRPRRKHSSKEQKTPKVADGNGSDEADSDGHDS